MLANVDIRELINTEKGATILLLTNNLAYMPDPIAFHKNLAIIWTTGNDTILLCSCHKQIQSHSSTNLHKPTVIGHRFYGRKSRLI